ncbi:hypothetical protein M9H77_17890 [Catharanthus roseus]|uniref:Uncharacterized protein n=1 Tax=Catharanthus roseus TaxID=4058 RepID=A0ACC0B5X5_CATRO|nr:hypothetical protein M9H77_17890 [Catharanthus roseus]
MDTPDHLYIITNTFNFCVVLIAQLGSTTILPLYSNMDCTAGTLFIGFISEQEHFIQLQLRDRCPLPPMQSLFLSTSSREASLATKSKGALAGIGRSTVNAKVSRATVSPQISSSPRTSCYLSACVPPEVDRLSRYLATGECPTVYVHSYNPTWDTARCRACKLEFSV